MRAAFTLPLVVAARVISLKVVCMKLTPSRQTIGVSFAALVATILLQKFVISYRLQEGYSRVTIDRRILAWRTVYAELTEVSMNTLYPANAKEHHECAVIPQRGVSSLENSNIIAIVSNLPDIVSVSAIYEDVSLLVNKD